MSGRLWPQQQDELSAARQTQEISQASVSGRRVAGIEGPYETVHQTIIGSF
jgi:hypothetical protein